MFHRMMFVLQWIIGNDDFEKSLGKITVFILKIT